MWSTNEWNIDLATGYVNISIPLHSVNVGPVPISASLVGSFGGIGLGQYGANALFASQFNLAVFRGALGSTPLVSFPQSCASRLNPEITYSVMEISGVSDPSGIEHPTTVMKIWPAACSGSNSETSMTKDGSGYTVEVIPDTTGSETSFSVYTWDPSGNKLYADYANGNSTPSQYTATTPDGLAVTYSGTPYTGGTITITGPLSSTPILSADLTWAGYVDGDASYPPIFSAASYSYTDVAGNTQKYSVTYTPFTIQTNFGCGTPEDLKPTSQNLPSAITLPGSNGAYNITYETTPGYPNSVTGRIASITFPSGGSISYSYAGGTGNANGYNCTSGVVPSLTVTVKDNNGHTEQWLYQNNNTNGTIEPFTVDRTDPAGDVTVYSFEGEFQFQKSVYPGAATGTPLETTTTCYNGNFQYCTTFSGVTPVALPITQRDVFTSFNAGANNLVETKYDTYGNAITVKQYDFGQTIWPAPSGTPLSQIVNSYGQSWNSSSGSCNAYASGTYIFNTPCFTQTTNSTGATLAQTQIMYSNTGHPTSTAKMTSGSSSLTSTATYNPNGTINTATDVNNALYTYAYNGTGGCNSLLATSVTVTGTGLPASGLTTSQTWNCSGGVMKSSTDANSQVTQYGFVNESGVADPFWRRLSVADPLGNVTWTDYSDNGTQVETYMNFPASSPTSTLDTLYTMDGLERLIQSKNRTGPGASTFDSAVTYTYGWTTAKTVGGVFTIPGAFTQQTIPGGTATTTNQMDALGRPATVTDGGGGTASSTYSNNDVLTVLGPAPSGENAKQRQLQYDGLGRLTSACEITAGTQTWPGGNCAQTASKTGYWATYSYDALNDLQGVTQNAQSSTSQGRSYSFDGLKRLTSETNPESGTVSYTYDSNSNNGCTSNSPGDLVQIVKASGLENCYYYDQLHRLITVGNNDEGAANNENPCKRFRYDSVSNGVQAAPSGYPSQPYVAGRLMEAETDNCSGTLLTDEWFSYNADGQMTGMWELTPDSGQYYYSSASFAANSAVTSLHLASPSLYTMTWTLDGEGRLSTLTDTTSNQPLVAGATYWPSTYSPTVTLQGTDSDAYSLDTNTGRMTKYVFTVGSSNVTGKVNWNPNGTLNQLAITDGFNSGGTQTCNYNPTAASGTGYDDLGRLVGANCGSIWSQTFSFDPFGNIDLFGNDAWTPTYNTATNHYSVSGMAYDADGNLTYDNSNYYSWNAYGKMATVAVISSPQCGTSGKCFTYDALGRAVEINNNGSISEIVYSAIGKTAVMSGSTLSYAYTPAPGGGTVIYQNTGGCSGGCYSFVHRDWLGTARLNSAIKGHYLNYDRAFAPYGQMYDNFGSTGWLDFTGDMQDMAPDNNLYDTTNRELPNWQGRWPSPDPAGLEAADPTNPQSWNRYAYALNNPLRYTDPMGLYCFYGGAGDTPDNDSDPTDYDFGASGPGDCGEGGQWINTSTVVNVNSDGSEGPTFEDGQQIFPDTIPLQPTFGNCVKSGTDYFSLQHGLQAATGGTLGNSWVSSAFLGSSVSSAITLGQYGVNFIAPSSNSPSGAQTFSSTAGEVLSDAAAPAASKLAPSVPNVAFTVAASAGVAVQTPTSSAALNLSGSLSGTVPLNAAATTGAKALSLLGTVKLPFDLAVGGFSALVCSIGR